MMLVFPTFSPTHAPAGVTMVAGTTIVEGLTAYGYVSIGTGSVSGQPLTGETLAGLVYFPDMTYSLLEFDGDAVAALTGKTLYVNGVDFALDAADSPPSYNGSTTYVQWFSAGPAFADGVSYNISIE